MQRFRDTRACVWRHVPSRACSRDTQCSRFTHANAQIQTHQPRLAQKKVQGARMYHRSRRPSEWMTHVCIKEDVHVAQRKGITRMGNMGADRTMCESAGASVGR
jgi:hypothetical protein